MAEGQDKSMISNLRVLDERAFEEFSSHLGNLIEEANASSGQLEELVSRTNSLSESATSAKSQLDQRLELSARVLKIARDQLDRVEGSLGTLNESQQKVEDLSSQLKEQLGSFNTHLEEAMEEVDRRVTDAVDGLEKQRRDGDQARQRVGELLETAHRLGEHFSAVEGQLAGGIETFQQGLRQALEEMSTGNSLVERTSSKLDEQVFALKSRVVAFADGIEQWLKPALAEMETHRQDLERAGEEVRHQLGELSGRVSQALQDIEDRINIGLADLSSRQHTSERTTETIRAALDDLQRQLAEWTEDLRHRYGQLGTLAADSVRPLLEQVRKQIEGACVSEADLANRLGELHGRLDGSLNRVADELGAALEAMRVQLTESVQSGLAEPLAEMRETIEAIEDRLTKIAGETTGGHDRLLAELERQDRVHQRALSDLQGEIQSRQQSSEDDAAAQRTQLADGQAHLREVLVRLEDRLSTAILALDDRRASEDERVAANLSTLREQLSTLGGRIETEVGPLLDSLRQRLRDDLETKIVAATERLDNRVAEILTALEARSRRVEDDTTAHREQLGQLLSLMSGAVDRLEEQVTAPLRDLVRDKTEEGERVARRVDEEVTASLAKLSQRNAEDAQQLTGDLAGVKDQLENLAARLHGEVAGALAELTRRGSEQGDKVVEQVSDIQSRLEQAVDRVDQRVDATLTELGRRAAEQDEGLGQRVSELQEALEAISGRIKNRIEPAISALQPRFEDDEALEEKVSDVMARVRSELDRSTGALGDRLAAALDERGRTDEQRAGAQRKQLADLREQWATLDERLADVQPRLGALEEGGEALAARVESGIEQGLADVRAAVEATSQQLERRLEQAARPDQDRAEPDSALHEQLAALAERVETAAARLESGEARLTELWESTVAPSGEAAPAGGQGASIEPIKQALAQLEERLTGAMSDLGARPESGAADLVTLEDHLSALSDQLRCVDSRLGAVEPHLQALQERPAGDGASAEVLAETLGRLEESLTETVNKAEQRMLEAVADLETRLAAGIAPEPGATPARGQAARSTGTRDPQKLVKTLLEAVNSGDSQAIRRFVATEYAESALADRGVEDRIEVYVSFHEDAGELELRHIEKSESNEVVALVQERGTLEWHRLQFQLEPNPPHKIMVVNIDSV